MPASDAYGYGPGRAQVFCFPVLFFFQDIFFSPKCQMDWNAVCPLWVLLRGLSFMHACACACTLCYLVRDLAEHMRLLGCLVLLLCFVKTNK